MRDFLKDMLKSIELVRREPRDIELSENSLNPRPPIEGNRIEIGMSIDVHKCGSEVYPGRLPENASCGFFG